MNVPKLRFKEFADEWQEYVLQNESDVRDGTHDSPKYIDNGYPLITSKNLSDMGTLDFSNVRYLKKEDFDKINERSKVNIGDILFGMIGTIGKPVRVKRDDFAIKNVALIKEKGLIKNDYLIHYLHTPIINKQFTNNQDGGTQKFISLEKIRKMKINIPSREEQKKLILFFNLLDKKIQLQTKKIEALKLFKKGLFDIQLKINGKESIMFDDFLDEVTEKSSIQNQYPVLSSTSKGLFLQSDYFNKQASSENNVGYKILKRNQLVLSPQNLWMGNININNIFDIGIVSPSYRVYNIDIKKMDLNYFNYWIKTPKALYSYLISSEQGASIVRRNLNIEMFNQISLKVPKLEKQHIIGNKIYQFNLKINFEEEKLKQLHKLKKALLQNMFV